RAARRRARGRGAVASRALRRFPSKLERTQVGAELGAELAVGERELDVGLQESLLAAAVVARALIAVGVHLFAAQQSGDAIGELDLAADAALLPRDLVEDARRQHVAPGDAEPRRRDLGGGLLDDLLDVDEPIARRLAGDDAVAAGMLRRHFLDGDDRRLPGVELLD